jgi:hypothetical protein
MKKIGPAISGSWLKNGNPVGNPQNALRCGAKTRRGTLCQSSAMKNGRCRMHGGASTGARTPEGIERIRKAHWKTGYFSKQAITERREHRAACQRADFALAAIKASFRKLKPILFDQDGNLVNDPNES